MQSRIGLRFLVPLPEISHDTRSEAKKVGYWRYAESTLVCGERGVLRQRSRVCTLRLVRCRVGVCTPAHAQKRSRQSAEWRALRSRASVACTWHSTEKKSHRRAPDAAFAAQHGDGAGAPRPTLTSASGAYGDLSAVASGAHTAERLDCARALLYA